MLPFTPASHTLIAASSNWKQGLWIKAAGTEHVEPYSIRCTTCRARLKVRKPEAVGQIVSCPRCGSMVMVHPQSPQTDSHDRDRDDATPNHDAKTSRACRTGGKLPAGHLDNASYDSVHDLLDDDDGTRRRETQLAASAATATLASKSRASRPNPSHAQSTMVTTRSMSGLRIFGRATLLAIAMGVGAAMATGSYYLSKRIPLNRSTKANAPVIEAVAAPPTPITEQTESSQNQDESTTVTAPPLADPTLESPNGVGISDPSDSRPIELAPNKAPAEVQSARLDESNGDQSQPAFVARDKRTTPIQLARLRTVLKPNAPTSRAPRTTVELPPRRELDAEARLSESIGKLNLPKLSLIDMARLMSSISTVPISFHESAFAFGATPNSTVTATANNEPIQLVVNRAIKRLKLTTRIDGDHLIVEHASRSRTESKQVQHDISDLVEHEADLPSFAETVTESLPRLSAGSRISAEQQGRLTAKLPHYGHLQLAVLLDGIRTARGLTFNRRFNKDVTSIQPAYRFVDQRLSRRITLRYEKPVRLDQLLQEFEEQTKLNVLVDWHALDREGWNESTLISSNFWQEPAIDVLSDMLAQFGGTYIAILPNTICITLPSSERERLDIGFFPIDDLLDAGHPLAQIVDLTKQSIGAAGFADHGGHGAVAFDAISRMLIVRLPQSDLRIVDQIMANWRSLN